MDTNNTPSTHPLRGNGTTGATGASSQPTGGAPRGQAPAPSVDRADTPPRPLAGKAAETTRDNPWPVRVLSTKIAEYIDRMVPLWIEGQIVQLNRRPGAGMAFVTLRDTEQDMSLPLSIFARNLAAAGPLTEGAHVVAQVKPTFWTKRGSFQLQASEIAQVGVGELLARIEQLKNSLAAEGLFDASRKKPLPFLPQRVGLICGRESEAMHDVLVNAQLRWPAVQFEVREVAVQGVNAVPQVSAALRELDDRDDVDVIVIARGGGAVEDLLPFSNEALVRLVADARTPVVSAIGHERDTPILDLVADVRASTPTDAAKRIVPMVAEEQAGVDSALSRIRGALSAQLDREYAGLSAVRSRPVLARPDTLIDGGAATITQARERLHVGLDRLLLRAGGQVSELRAQVRALSPAATLERGYAIVQGGDRSVVRDVAQVSVPSDITVTVARGSLTAAVTAVQAEVFPSTKDEK